jgi:spermidine synthase
LSGDSRGRARLLLFAVGFLSLVGQVALLREVGVASFGVELVYVVALAAWLFFTAAGVIGGGGTVRLAGPLAPWVVLAAAVALPASVAFSRGSRLLFGAVPGAFLSLPLQGATLALSLFVPALLFGLLFGWGARDLVERGGTLASAYAVEGAGSVVGGLASTLVFAAGVPNLAFVLAGALAATLLAIRLAGGRGRTAARIAGTLAAILLLAALVRSRELDFRMTAWNHPNLVGTADTPYGRIAVERLEGQLAVFVADALAFDTGGTEAEEFVEPVLLEHPAPRSILVLGGGSAGIVREAQKHAPARIDDVELDSRFRELVTPHLPPEERAALAAPNVRRFVADPRAFLSGSDAGGDRWDVILVGMPDPSSGEANRFYTREFFELARGRLRPGGIVAFRLRSSENLWSPLFARRLASIRLSLSSVFPEILILPGATNVVLASPAPLVRDPALLSRRFRARAIEARLVRPEYLDYLFTNDRFAGIDEALRFGAVVPNSDAEPICYPYTVLIWLAKLAPELALADPVAAAMSGGTGRNTATVVAVVFVALLAAAGRSAAAGRIALAGLAGFVGMALEALLLLEYQIRQGVLYQDLGLLLTTFMAGLALGARLLDRLAKRTAGEAGRGDLARPWGIAVVSGLLLVSTGIAAGIGAGATGRAPFVATLAAAGLLASALFAYSSLHAVGDPADVVSPLYVADLAGGCLAALLVALVLVPFAGLVTTAWVIAAVTAAALIVV